MPSIDKTSLWWCVCRLAALFILDFSDDVTILRNKDGNPNIVFGIVSYRALVERTLHVIFFAENNDWLAGNFWFFSSPGSDYKSLTGWVKRIRHLFVAKRALELCVIISGFVWSKPVTISHPSKWASGANI